MASVSATTMAAAAMSTTKAAAGKMRRRKMPPTVLRAAKAPAPVAKIVPEPVAGIRASAAKTP